jgi:hypothetical protein
MSHANAVLTPRNRLRLARCVVDDGWPLRRAAERSQVSVTTAARLGRAGRYRQQGEDGMQDRSSRPRSSPRRTCPRRERRIIASRVNSRWGPARIGYLHRAPRPVQVRSGEAVPAGPGHGRGDPPLRAPQPREMVHVDIKKLGRIPDGGGHRVVEKRPATETRPARRPTGVPATPSCATPSMTIPGWPTPKSSRTRRRKPQPRSGDGQTPIFSPAESPSSGS